MSRRRARLLALVCALPLAIAACGGGGATTPAAATPRVTPTAAPAEAPATQLPATATAAPSSEATPAQPAATATATQPAATPTAPPTSAQAPPATPRPVALRVAIDREFERPIELGAFPGGLVFVAEQNGLARLFDPVSGQERGVLLDIRDRVSRSANEEGLLSVALDPSFAANGYVWAYYSASSPRRSVLSRFTRSGGAAAGGELVVLEVPQPFGNHNGGAIRFGPDGMLYLGFGDGGGRNDPQGNGQNRLTLLGSIIRIDVSNASAARPYVVPADNPFAAQNDGQPEIWAFGFRNPWRMAFDPESGRLWVADVGQNAVEEIDIVVRGGNYGWNVTEGDRCFRPSTNCPTEGLSFPVATYTHSFGCSVSGGIVYRGTRVPEISGAYIYGDFCSGRVWAISADDWQSGPVLIAEAPGMTSFGTDAAGRVYLLPDGGPIYELVSP